MRLSVATAAMCLCLVGVIEADDARASIRKQTNIPAEGLSAALQALAKDRDFQIVYVSEESKDVRTLGAGGEFTPEEALKKLLSGTGLTYRYLDEKTVTIVRPTAGSPSADAPVVALYSGPSEGEPNRDGKGSGERLRVARLDQGQTGISSQAGAGGAPSPGASASGQRLEEIVVTAQKREERLQDVPVPVSVINVANLVQNNQPSLADYYSSVPGLNIQPRIISSDNLSIRGISTGGYSNATVGITVDDVPYGASGGLILPDIDPSDLARIEVLRGPQGTLYGASSMGGLIKYVTADPSTDRVSGQVQAGFDGVHNGAEPGYSFRGSVNMPISDTLAVRASAFTRLDPGYIDNPALKIDGINEDRVSGGRLSGLWRPSESVSLKVSALYQDAKGDGSSDVFLLPGFGELQQNYIAGIGGYDRQVEAYSANLTARLGGVELTSITGYNISKATDSFDLTYLYLPGTPTPSPYTISGDPIFDYNKTDKVTEELRVSAPIGQGWEWLSGAFYTHEDTASNQYYPITNPTTGAAEGNQGFAMSPMTYEEYAAFADLTYHFTDRIDLQVGGRESHTYETQNSVAGGLFGAGVPGTVVSPEATFDYNAFTYLVTPRFRISEDLMMYARFASGYRPGGPNERPGGVVPRGYTPDKTDNNEIGLKGDFLNHTLSIDASVYYIDWKNIQISLYNPSTGFGYQSNGSRAKSEGVEFSVQSRPTTGLTIGAWVVWTEAVLTEPFPPDSTVYGEPGDRLPNSSRWSGNISLDQEFPLSRNLTGFLGADASYVGEREGVFTTSSTRQVFPDYSKVDLRAGIKRDSWTANLYVTNLADKRGLISGGLGAFPDFAFQIIPPRTVGLNISRGF